MSNREELNKILADAVIRRMMALQVGDRVKSRDYEKFKARVLKLNLSAGEYEKAIRRLATALGI